MNKLKNGFLPVLAVLAMSFTIASNKEVFKTIKFSPKAPGDCYTNIMLISSPSEILNQADLCPDEGEAENLIGSCVYNAFTLVSTSSNPKGVGQACAGANTVFCCAKIEIEPQGTCPYTYIYQISPNPQKYIITAVYCKPQG